MKCYCRDCQSFARYLGDSVAILDAHGGTDIVATSPHRLRFTRGLEHLRCVSLSDRGLLRWYAGCCRTPIGNIPRNPRFPYVGLVHNCLGASTEAFHAAFGIARCTVNAASASGPVDSTPLAFVVASWQISRNVLGARLSGAYRDNPFFSAGGTEPIVSPQVLTREARAALRGGVRAPGAGGG